MSAPLKILVVDDDEANRYFKAHVLARRDYLVREAGTCRDALRIVDTEHPALVLLDVKLPDGNGLEISGEIKRRQPGTIVLQTSAAFTTGKHRIAGLLGGADSYLVEPIEPEELLATVDSLLRLHQAEQELRTLNDMLEQRIAERTNELVEANRSLAAESQQRAAAEETLRHVEKLEAVGQLTGGVAHDFNNLLTVVIGNMELVEQELGKPQLALDKITRLVTTGRRAAENCERLTRQLLAFARRDIAQMEVVRPDELITRFDNFLRRALGERVELALSLGAQGCCHVDVGQFEAALLNLVINARDAMPTGGELRLTTGAVEIAVAEDLASAHIIFAPIAEPKNYVRISVADTGTGMPQDILSHAFEPFFTTKDIGQGSGLGLSQVYGFIRQSDGLLTVDTEMGVGTTINLYLPRTDAVTRAAPATRAEDEVPGGSETILIVEDNDLVLEFAVAIATDLGYGVLQATEAKAALDILAEDTKIDLLFTDIVLPNRVSGVELAEEARRLRPNLPVLLTTGYSGRGGNNIPLPAELPVIAKPYRQEELAKRLREIFDRR